MRLRSQILSALVLVFAASEPSSQAQQAVPRLPDPFRLGATAEVSYTGESEIRRGSENLGDISTWQYRAGLLSTYTLSESVELRLGTDWQRFDFQSEGGRTFPDAMQVVAFKVGMNWRFAEKWTLLTEVDPGIYSDFEDISWEDINAPAGVRLMYSASENLALVLGLQINLWNEYAVLPAVGARWRFADVWTLNLLFPRPRLEYAASERLSLYAGGEFKGTVVRTGEEFGTERGERRLDSEAVNYREIRTGAGLRYRLTKQLWTSLDTGWAFDRRFEFDDVGLQLNGDGAPYAQLSISATF